MATRNLTAGTFNTTINRNDLVLVDFHGSWCPASQSFDPVFAASAAMHPDVVHAQVDTAAEPRLSDSHQITAIPTLIAFKKGRMVHNQAGALSPAALEALVHKLKAVGGPGRPAAASSGASLAGAATSNTVQAMWARRAGRGR